MDSVINDRKNFLRRQALLCENFSEVSKFCPSSILEKAKRRRNSNKLLRRSSPPNDFVNMDNIIKIDKDDEGIKLFFNAVCRCVETVAKCVKHFFQDCSCTVRPAGSFPLNLKIETIDEFDFALTLEDKTGSCIKNHNVLVLKFENSVFVDIIKYIFCTSNCDKLSNYKVNLLRKSRAVNIKLSWTCSTGHEHSVSLDLALDLETCTTVQEFFESSNFPLKDTPFEGSINLNNNVMWSCWVDDNFGTGKVDTNIFDKSIFQKCSSSISPNITLCHRIGKSICAHISPYEGRYRDCQLTKQKVYCTKPIYCSYLLKQLLFKQIIKFPLSDDWKIDVIPIRFASILEHFLGGSSVGGLFDKEPEHITKEPVEPFQKILNWMIEWLRNGCRKITVKPKWLNSNSSKIVRVITAQIGETLEFKAAVGSNVIMKASESVLSTLHGSCFKQSYWYFRFGTFDPQLIKTNIFRGIYQSFDGALSDMKQIDLSASDFTEAEKIILLLTCGLITEEDMKYDYYIKKLDIFNELLQLYGKTHGDVFHPELAQWYFIRFSDNFPNFSDCEMN